MKRHKFYLSLLLVVATVFLYSPALKYYFFQDDFYTLLVSQAHSLKDFLTFFIPGNEIYYRPFSMRIYFWLMQLIGSNSFHFHQVSLAIHIINSFLVWVFISKLTNWRLGWLSAFLYSTSSIHFISLFWISEVGLVFGIMFYLLSCLSFITIKHRSKKLVTASLFIFGLLSHEYLITLPAVLTLLHWFKTKSLKKIRSLAPYWAISGLYLIFRLFIFPISVSGTYAISIGKQTIKAVFWYFIWSLNILENIKDQLLPGLQIRSEFIQNFPIVSIMYIIFPILIVIFYIAATVQLFTNYNSKNRKNLLKILTFCVFWIIITLSVPLATPNHLYPLYSSLALVGFATWLAYISLNFTYKNIAAFILCLVWFSSSLYTLRLTEKIHWTVQEANKAEKIIDQALKLQPNPLSQSTFVLKNDYQTNQALYDQLALKYVFNDSSIKTHYGKVDPIVPPKCKLIKTAKLKKICLQDYNIYVVIK